MKRLLLPALLLSLAAMTHAQTFQGDREGHQMDDVIPKNEIPPAPVLNPEQALKRTNHKFDARFRAIERVLEKEGRNLDEETLEALDAVWQSVKGVEKE